jgi:filamentous hemagglutinin family protein
MIPSAQAIALNRVLGGDPSSIQGSLIANGRVFLLNPNGIVFGPTAKVEVASLLASTLNMRNDDFMKGDFRLAGASGSAVVNQGQIQAQDGGAVAMIAARVENIGEILAPNGQVLLAAGQKVRLDLGGPARIEIQEGILEAYIRNGGVIRADGGTVLMSVKAAGELASLAINNGGLIQARGLVRGNGGAIRLVAEGGVVKNSGTLDVTASEGKGGEILVTGAKVGISAGSLIDASGASGGGTVLLGGDYQGKNTEVINAQVSYVGEGAVVRANATVKGDGGKVIVWSDDSTRFTGSIEAKGGEAGGNGGLVEVSGKNYLDFRGQVNTSAAFGKNGTLLLDPTNLTIGNTASSGWVTNSSNVFGDFTSDANPNPAHDFSFLQISTLQAALANNDITVLSSCGTAVCAGDITLVDSLAWSSGKGLTLNATGSIYLNAAINSTGAATTQGGAFSAIAGTGNIQVNANITTAGGAATSIGLAGGSVTLNSTSGAVTFNNAAIVNTGGSAAASSGAAGGAAGNIAMTTSAGNITLNTGNLLAQGGAGNGAGAAGAGGVISLTSTTGALSQSSGSQIAGRDLKLDTTSGAMTLTSTSNTVERLAARSTSGNIAFTNSPTSNGLEIFDAGSGLTGVSTGSTGTIALAARNLLVSENISSATGAITLTGNNGSQQTGNFSGVSVAAGKTVSTANANITVSGRGGNDATGGQGGVSLASGAAISAGSAGTLTVTGIGGAAAGGNNDGVVLDNAQLGSAAGTGAILVTATGSSSGSNNDALSFTNAGKIGDTTGNRAITLSTTAGTSGVAYNSDGIGAYIGAGTGTVTLNSDAFTNTNTTSVRATGNLVLQPISASFSTPLSLSSFSTNFVFNGSATTGLNSLTALTLGKSGNTGQIGLDLALSLPTSTVTVHGGTINQTEAIAANTVNLTSTGGGNITQSANGAITATAAATLNSAGNITLTGNNDIAALTATATGSVDIVSAKVGTTNLSGNLSGSTVTVQSAGVLTQTGGVITATNLKVTGSNGAVTLNRSNNVGTLAASITGGDLTFSNAGSSGALTIGTVGGTVGITGTNAVTLNGLTDLTVNQAITANTSVALNTVSARNIDFGTTTAGKFSLDSAEYNLITAPSLTLAASGAGGIVNSAAMLHSGSTLTGLTLTAGTGGHHQLRQRNDGLQRHRHRCHHAHQRRHCSGQWRRYVIHPFDHRGR